MLTRRTLTSTQPGKNSQDSSGSNCVVQVRHYSAVVAPVGQRGHQGVYCEGVQFKEVSG